MSELESSGLLETQPAQPAAATATDTPPLSASHDSGRPDPGTSWASGSVSAEANLAALIVHAVTNDQAELSTQLEGNGQPEQQPADAAATAEGGNDDEPAEQRVLGDLDGAPTWREVCASSVLPETDA